jgi:predicted nucleic-acid-binding protein
MKLIDANTILRWLLNDDHRKSGAFERILQNAMHRKDELFVADVTIAEIIWVLESHYELSKNLIVQSMRSLLSCQEVLFENRERLFDAVTIYENHSVDYIDAYLAALGKTMNVHAILSYDRDFDKIPGIRRLEP